MLSGPSPTESSRLFTEFKICVNNKISSRDAPVPLAANLSDIKSSSVCRDAALRATACLMGEILFSPPSAATLSARWTQYFFVQSSVLFVIIRPRPLVQQRLGIRETCPQGSA